MDGWLAETKNNLIPVALLPCFCWAAGSLEPLRVLAACLEATVIDAQEEKLLALAKIDMETKRLARRKRLLQLEVESHE